MTRSIDLMAKPDLGDLQVSSRVGERNLFEKGGKAVPVGNE